MYQQQIYDRLICGVLRQDYIFCDVTLGAAIANQPRRFKTSNDALGGTRSTTNVVFQRGTWMVLILPKSLCQIY